MEQKIRVLIADGDKEFTEGFELACGKSGLIELVGVAADGRKALELAGQLSPDILLIDLVLPEIDGLTVVQRLQGHRDCDCCAECVWVGRVERGVFAAECAVCDAQAD